MPDETSFLHPLGPLHPLSTLMSFLILQTLGQHFLDVGCPSSFKISVHHLKRDFPELRLAVISQVQFSYLRLLQILIFFFADDVLSQKLRQFVFRLLQWDERGWRNASWACWQIVWLRWWVGELCYLELCAIDMSPGLVEQLWIQHLDLAQYLDDLHHSLWSHLRLKIAGFNGKFLVKISEFVQLTIAPGHIGRMRYWRAWSVVTISFKEVDFVSWLLPIARCLLFLTVFHYLQWRSIDHELLFIWFELIISRT